MVDKKVDKKVDKQGITELEREILHLLTEQYLTPNKIAIKRNCSRQAVYKIIKSLKDKGIINKQYRKVDKIRCTLQPVNLLRLHGQEFNIKILYKGQQYKKLINKLIDIDGNSIRCYRNSIEVYSGHSFYGETVQKVTARSIRYFERLFMRIENDMKVIIVKSRKDNITMVKSHYAETGNEYAQECEKKGYKVRIYAKEDGKLWFMIDNSFNLHEAETVHTETARDDMDKIRKHFNDLRDNPHFRLSEVSKYMVYTTQQMSELASGLNVLVKLLKPQKQAKKPFKYANGDRPRYIG
jgi:biotin operon repressor